MKKINIVSPIFDQCGYSRHGRSLANACHKAGIDVRLETTKPDQWERFSTDAEFKMITKPFDSTRTSIMIGQPAFWRLESAKKSGSFFGFCVWEGDKIPSYWHEFLNNSMVDKILVPSQHTKDAILNSRKPYMKDLVIETIPHGVDTKVFYPESKFDTKEQPFTFVANKGWSEGLYDRGGIQFLLQAFTEEFSEDESVCLKLKINSTYNKPDWNLKDEITKLKLKKNKNVLVTMDMIDDDALRHFYNEGDVFVSPSMAEAFNLPCLEAMSCGLPVITTKFGGQSDFVNDKNGWLIDKGSLEYWSKDIIYEDTKWFKPDIKQIQKLLRYCYEHHNEVKEKGSEALKTAKEWTWEATAIKLKNLLPD